MRYERNYGWMKPWLCALTFILVDALLFGFLRASGRASPTFAEWRDRPGGVLVTTAVHALLALGFAFAFSGSRGVAAFSHEMGLCKGVSRAGCAAAVAGVLLALAYACGSHQAWVAGGLHDQEQVISSSSATWWTIVIDVTVLAPIYEEILTRGFLYRAFRAQVPMVPSMCVIFLFSGFLHRYSLRESWWILGVLVALWILLCVVREKSDSLWDCILTHSMYNLTSSGLLPEAVFIILIAFFISSWPSNSDAPLIQS